MTWPGAPERHDRREGMAQKEKGRSRRRHGPGLKKPAAAAAGIAAACGLAVLCICGRDAGSGAEPAAQETGAPAAVTEAALEYVTEARWNAMITAYRMITANIGEAERLAESGMKDPDGTIAHAEELVEFGRECDRSQLLDSDAERMLSDMEDTAGRLADMITAAGGIAADASEAQETEAPEAQAGTAETGAQEGTEPPEPGDVETEAAEETEGGAEGGGAAEEGTEPDGTAEDGTAEAEAGADAAPESSGADGGAGMPSGTAEAEAGTAPAAGETAGTPEPAGSAGENTDEAIEEIITE